MNKATKIVIVIALIAVVGIVIAVKQRGKNSISEPDAVTSSNTIIENTDKDSETIADTKTANLPRLVDLGAGKCIPCKMMAPILEELKSQYQGKLEVVFIDVWENQDEAEKYNIKIIPTQIFYDASGKELFRHEGFFSKEDIIAKLSEMGIR